MTPKKFWQGTNFYVALSLLIASLWTSFSTETGDVIASTVISIGAGAFAVRQLLKNGQIDFQNWLGSTNTWNYLAQLVTMIFGAQFADLLTPLQSLVDAIGAGNFQAIIAAVFNLGTIIFYLVRDGRNQPELSPA